MNSFEAAPADRVRRLSDNLAAVRERVEAACSRLDRSPDDVRLVVVTKTYPPGDVAALAALGVRDVGENRDQEASAKAAALSGQALTWHFIGQVQTNKARSVAAYADVVHSVDRPALVAALSRARTSAAPDRPLRCLVQVSLDGDPARGGVTEDRLPVIAEAIVAAPGLELAGVMAVAPLGVPAGEAFAALPRLSAAVRALEPAAVWISAGMSGDLEEALAWGATHLRVGSAILGHRVRVQ